MNDIKSEFIDSKKKATEKSKNYRDSSELMANTNNWQQFRTYTLNCKWVCRALTPKQYNT